MADTPQPPPEAVALDRAVTRSRMSVREAAKRAGVSEGRWRQIVKGYQSAGGQQIPVTAPKNTLAKMAHAVGMTPDMLRATGRGDAADVLEDLTENSPTEATDHGDVDPADEALARVMRSDLTEDQQRKLILLLLEERRDAERRRGDFAEQLISLLRDDP